MMSDKEKKSSLTTKMNIWKFSVHTIFFLVLFENVRYFRYSCTEIRDDSKQKKKKNTSIEDKV